MRFTQHPRLAGGAAAGAAGTGAPPEMPREPPSCDECPELHRHTRSQRADLTGLHHSGRAPTRMCPGYLDGGGGAAATLLGHPVTSPWTTKSARSSNIAWKFTFSIDLFQSTGRGRLAPWEGPGLSLASPRWATVPEPPSLPSSLKPGRGGGQHGGCMDLGLVNFIIYYYFFLLRPGRCQALMEGTGNR